MGEREANKGACRKTNKEKWPGEENRGEGRVAGIVLNIKAT